MEPYYARTHGTTLRRHGLREVQCVGRVFEWGGARPTTALWLFAFQGFRNRSWSGLLSSRRQTRSWRCGGPGIHRIESDFLLRLGAGPENE